MTRGVFKYNKLSKGILSVKILVFIYFKERKPQDFGKVVVSNCKGLSINVFFQCKAFAQFCDTWHNCSKGWPVGEINKRACLQK